MPLLRVTLWTLAAAGLVACGRGDTARGVDSPRATEAAKDSVVVSGVWPDGLGPTLVVPADTENLAVVLYPVFTTATAGLDSGVALVSSGGDVVRRRVKLGLQDSLHCGGAPLAHVAGATPASWAIGISGASAKPLHSDSMDALNSADSVDYTAGLARVAAAVGANTTSRFTGLPFSIATLRRFRIGDREVVVAQMVRRLNQEAEPLEERTLVVAERPSTGGRFSLAFGGRSSGREDDAAHFDMLAAVRTANATLVIVAREKPTETAFDILERDATGAWRVRWSRTIGC